jgi:transposase
VVPYRLSGKRGKNDAADAAAIGEAVTRPSMRFVPPKSGERLAALIRRLDQAIGLVWSDDCFTDEVNGQSISRL